MTEFRSIFAPPLTAIILCLVPSGSAKAQIAALEHAKDLIATQYDTIFLIMHPTATLHQVAYKGMVRREDGFALTYTFTFDGFAGVKSSTMRFIFDDGGDFAALEKVSSTSPVAPFTASKLALELLKKLAKEIGKPDPDGKVAAAIEAADPKLALELMLKLVQNEAPAAADEPTPEPPRKPRVPSSTDPELLELIAKAESMDDAERKYWYDILPSMNADQIARLKEILLTEKRKIEELERKYQEELGRLNKKHGDSADGELIELIKLIKSHPGIPQADRERLLNVELRRMTGAERAALLKILREQSQRRIQAENNLRGGNLKEFTKADFAAQLELIPSLAAPDRAALLAEFEQADATGREIMRLAAKAEQLAAGHVLQSATFDSVKPKRK